MRCSILQASASVKEGEKDKNIEMWKIKQLIKSLQAARG